MPISLPDDSELGDEFFSEVKEIGERSFSDPIMQCSKCKEFKFVSQFRLDQNPKNWCLGCTNSYKSKRYHTYPGVREKALASRKARAAENYTEHREKHNISSRAYWARHRDDLEFQERVRAARRESNHRRLEHIREYRRKKYRELADAGRMGDLVRTREKVYIIDGVTYILLEKYTRY